MTRVRANPILRLMAMMTTRLKAVLGDEALKSELADFKTEFREHRREVNERFDRIDERFDWMHGQFNERFDQMHLGVMVKWIVGTLALFGTLITILVAIGKFAK